MYRHQYVCTYRRQYLHDHYQVVAGILSLEMRQLSSLVGAVELGEWVRSFECLPLDWPTVVPKR